MREKVHTFPALSQESSALFFLFPDLSIRIDYTDILLTESLSGADQEGRDEDVRRGQSPAWHELPQTPLVVTHAIFQAMVAHTPSHALTVELTHHPLGHSFMCSHHSTLISLPTAPTAGGRLHLKSFSPNVCPPMALPSTPTRRLQEPLGGARTVLRGLLTFPRLSRCPECWGGGAVVPRS